MLFLIGCGGTTSVKKDQTAYTPTLRSEATFKVEHWNKYKSEENWNVTIFFEMENTGNVQIGYYEVFFTVTCEDSSTYTGEGWGPYETLEKAYEGKVGNPVFPGNTSRGMGGAKNCKSKPISVKVKDWKLYQNKKD